MTDKNRSNWKLGFLLFLVPFSLLVIANLPSWIMSFIPPEFLMTLWLILFVILIWKLTE